MGSVIASSLNNPRWQSFGLALILSCIPLFLQWPLFWDNLPYVGGIADYFYEHGVLKSLFHLPVDWDVAHSPIMASLLSLTWQLLGKSLLSSYLLQLPFVFICVFCLLEILAFYLKGVFPKLVVCALFLADTSVFTQINQVGYEWVMLAPFFLGLYHVMRSYQSKELQEGVIARYGLFIWLIPFTQLRGINLFVLLIGISFVLNINKAGFRKALRLFFQKDILLVFGAALITFSWLLLHKLMCGYWTNATSTAWSGEHLVLSNFSGFLYRLGLCFWRMTDYSFAIYPLLMSILFLVSFEVRSLVTKEKKAFWMILFLFFVLAFQYSLFAIPICHRYFLALHLIIPVAGIIFLLKLENLKLRLFSLLFLFFGVLSGHFWQYPERMANGREVQSSSIKYFVLRDSLDLFLKEAQIDRKKVVSHFPICVPEDWVYLSNSNMPAICADIDTAKAPMYVAYSNFCNAFTQTEREGLVKMKTVRLWKNGPLHIILYKVD